jgi:hypothetical protein
VEKTEEVKEAGANETAGTPKREILDEIRRNNPEAYSTMLENARKEMEYLGERFPQIIDQGDVEALHDLRHKHTTMMSIFNAHELSAQLAEAIEFMRNNAADGRLEELKVKIVDNLSSLQEKIGDLIRETNGGK